LFYFPTLVESWVAFIQLFYLSLVVVVNCSSLLSGQPLRVLAFAVFSKVLLLLCFSPQDLAEQEGNAEKAKSLGEKLQELEERADQLDKQRTKGLSAIRCSHSVPCQFQFSGFYLFFFYFLLFIYFFLFFLFSYINERNRHRNVVRAELALKVRILLLMM